MRIITTIILAALTLAATAQTKIRYWSVNNPKVRYTVDLYVTKTSAYTLAYDNGTKLVTGSQLQELLSEPMWPDVPWSVHIPVYKEASFHYEYDTAHVYHPEGYWTVEGFQVKVWDVSPVVVEAMRAAYISQMQQHFVIARQYRYPYVPDGEDIRWQGYFPEEVFPWKRWKNIPVTPGLYTGQPVWVEWEGGATYEDFEYYQRSYNYQYFSIVATIHR